MEQLLKVSERVRNIERMFDVRQGLLRKNDTLPNKIFNEPLERGPFKGEVMDRKKFEQMKDEYYELRGWDKETGIPKDETLVALGLEDLVNEPVHQY